MDPETVQRLMALVSPQVSAPELGRIPGLPGTTEYIADVAVSRPAPPALTREFMGRGMTPYAASLAAGNLDSDPRFVAGEDRPKASFPDRNATPLGEPLSDTFLAQMKGARDTAAANAPTPEERELMRRRDALLQSRERPSRASTYRELILAQMRRPTEKR